MSLRLKEAMFRVRCREPGCSFNSEFMVRENIMGATEADVDSEALKIARNLGYIKHDALFGRTHQLSNPEVVKVSSSYDRLGTGVEAPASTVPPQAPWAPAQTAPQVTPPPQPAPVAPPAVRRDVSPARPAAPKTVKKAAPAKKKAAPARKKAAAKKKAAPAKKKAAARKKPAPAKKKAAAAKRKPAKKSAAKKRPVTKKKAPAKKRSAAKKRPSSKKKSRR